MYTLEQLAHFDRCMFTSWLAEKLEEQGVEEHTVRGVEQFISHERFKGNNVGVIRLYQEFITDEELTKALDAVVYAFVNQHKI
jgi:flavin-dependent dehydrogenase